MFARSLFNRFAVSVAVIIMAFSMLGGIMTLSGRKVTAVADWSYEDYIDSLSGSEGDYIDIFEDEIPL